MEKKESGEIARVEGQTGKKKQQKKRKKRRK